MDIGAIRGAVEKRFDQATHGLEDKLDGALIKLASHKHSALIFVIYSAVVFVAGWIATR